MFPDSTGLIAVPHLGICVFLLAAWIRRLERAPTVRAAWLGLLRLAALGCVLSVASGAILGFALYGGASIFSVMLTVCWTLGLVVPAAGLGAGAVLLRAHRSARLPGWWTPGAFGLIAALVTWQAFVVEPTDLQVSHHIVYSDRVDKPLRIAVVADLQTDHPGAHDTAALKAVMAAHPDLIVFPGDIIQSPDSHSDAVAWQDLARITDVVGLHAPLGVVASQGDADWRSTWHVRARQAGIETLAGPVERRQLRADVVLTGLDLATSATPHTIKRPNQAFHIVVGHRPAFAMGEVDAELLLAGHTHGGQVQLPWFGPLLTLSKVPRAWASGRTDLGGGRTLLVSRGVGMERSVAPRLRLLCKPEVLIVDVLPRR